MKPLLLPVWALVKASLNFDRIEVFHALLFPLCELFPIFICGGVVVLEEWRHVAFRNLVGSMDLGPRVVAHSLVHARLETLAARQNFIVLGFRVDCVLIFVYVDHLSAATEITR